MQLSRPIPEKIERSLTFKENGKLPYFQRRHNRKISLSSNIDSISSMYRLHLTVFLTYCTPLYVMV